VTWKELREQEAELALARQRHEYEAEEDFDMQLVGADDVPVTRPDMEIMSAITSLEEVMTCGDPECGHVDCTIVHNAVKHLIDYSYLRRSVRAHHEAKGRTVPVGGWSIADRRLWDIVEDR